MQENKFKFNLVKAQKHLSKLSEFLTVRHEQASRYAYTKPKYTPKISININQMAKLETYYDDFSTRFEKAKDECRNEFENRLNVMRAHVVLKDIVHSKNTEVGLDATLSQIKLLTEERNLYKSMLDAAGDNIQSADDLYGIYTNFKKERDQQGDAPEQPNEVRFYEKPELNEKIKELTKQIEQLEDKRDTLNATTYIEVTFSTQIADVLGL
jgi:tetrahydromethanopterin S-methyltransferase subunit B